jgi:hypothetical protein
MNKQILCYTLLLALVACVRPVPSWADDPEYKRDSQSELNLNGQRVFTCANSLHYFVPKILADIAKAAGIKEHQTVGSTVIGGSNVSRHWDWPEKVSKAKQALRAGEVDVLTLSPVHLPDKGIESFARFALEHNPQVRITVQETWLRYDEYDTTTPFRPREVDHNAPTAEDLRKLHEPFFKSMDDHIRDLNKSLAGAGKPVLFAVPAGQAVIALRERIVAGEAFGLKTQSELFWDAIGHPNEPLQVLVTYCHFAVIYRHSPIGLPMPDILKNANKPNWDDKLNQLLQEIAWDAVIHHPLSGVKEEAVSQ